MIPQPLSTFVWTVLGGGAAQVLAVWLNLPSIVFLLVFGILLGPAVLGWVQPLLIANLATYVELMVAVILFTGGMSLQLAEIRAHGRVVGRLLTAGLLTTFVATTLAARLIVGIDWAVAALFGALMVVTGPTVILPLLKRVPIQENLHSILKWEGILIDPLGVILTIVVLELILAGQPDLSATLGLFGVRLLTGGVLGLAAGFAIAAAFRKRFFLGGDVQELGGLASVAVVIFFYGVSEALFRESGLVCVTVAGIVLGNTEFPYKKQVSAFKEQVALVALSVLFILLAASVRPSSLQSVLGPGMLLVGVMMLVVRPLGVLASSLGTPLTRRERTLLALTAPRGVVAASFAFLISQILAENGREDADVLVPLSFLVICATVLFNGLLGRPIARALGVYEGERRGLLVVGANALGRLLARELTARGVDVRIVDKSGREVAEARRQGFHAFRGDATDSHFLDDTVMKGVGKVLAVTPNQEVNILACAAAAAFVGDDDVFRLDDRRERAAGERSPEESWGRPVGTVRATPGELNDAARQGRLVASWIDGAEATIESDGRWPLLGLRSGPRVVFPGEPDFSGGGREVASDAVVLYLTVGQPA